MTSGAPLSGARLLGLAGLATVAGALVVVGLPRTRRLPLPGRRQGAPRCEALELDAAVLPPAFRAVARLENGSREVVLERDEPAAVLTDALALARELGVPLLPGWGLDATQLDELLHPPLHGHQAWLHDGPLELDAPILDGQRAAALTTSWAAAFVLVATILMSESARARVTPGLLSLALPALSVVVVLLVALWLLGARERITLTAETITRRLTWFGLGLGQAKSVRFTPVAAAVVAPPKSVLWHVIVAGQSGLMAFKARGGTPQLAQLRVRAAAQVAHRAAE